MKSQNAGIPCIMKIGVDARPLFLQDYLLILMKISFLATHQGLVKILIKPSVTTLFNPDQTFCMGVYQYFLFFSRILQKVTKPLQKR